jgi:hypothetical protein
MISILDNILAGIVATTTAIVLMSAFLRVQSVNIDTTAAYASRQMGANVATWIENDLLMMGRNMPTKTMPITAVQDSAGFTKRFAFVQGTVNSSGTTLVEIETRYTLEYAGVESASTGQNLYRVVRDVRVDGGPWSRDGATPPVLRTFKIEVLDHNMKPFANLSQVLANTPQNVRNVGVQFSLAPGFRSKYATLAATQHASTLMFSYENGALVNLNP